MNYYNDNDPYCCRWLENLIEAGELPDGYVDNRPIQEVTSGDIEGFTQCHFFAGIGGWPLALRMAGWPDGRSVWTGSCPCQPFSAAGKRKGIEDERHLWPEFLRLIAYGAPPALFGEQVASADGKRWLAGVRSDLEMLGYGVGAADLCAAGVGAPHIRQRLWWVAESTIKQMGRTGQPWERADERVERLAESDGRNARDRDVQRSGEQRFVEKDGSVSVDRLADHIVARLEERPGERTDARTERAAVERDRDAGGVAITQCNTGDARRVANESGESDGADCARSHAQSGRSSGLSYWSDYSLIPCLDGRSRRVEPGSFPLAHGVPNRVGRLRAYGNAIVPACAAAFVTAYLETER